MQNRNTWAAPPVPCQHGCSNDLQEAKLSSHCSRVRGQRKSREKQVAPACSLSSSLEQAMFTCRLQVAAAGPVNITGWPVGWAQPGHLKQAIWSQHC